jgi:two-component system response regulator AtoC
MSQGDAAGTFPVIEDAQMHAIYAGLARVAMTAIPVLLLGETGVGKEVVAEWVHRRSGRPDEKFVRINCAGLAESVVETELFGHERGAFTGATQARAGLFEAADGGTLFLDEIGEMTARTQAKVLRVLETGELSRVGSTRPLRVDVRFVAATHRDLGEMIARGEFRQDLYFRLNAITVEIPPLRRRTQEIASLARLFLARSALKLARPELALDPSAMQALSEHPWPGNVRELRNVIERAAAMTTEPVIGVSSLGLRGIGRAETAPAPAPPTVGARGSTAAAGGIRAQVRAFERAQIIAALESTNGNQTRAAKLLGLSRRTLTKKLAAHGLGRRRGAYPTSTASEEPAAGSLQS